MRYEGGTHGGTGEEEPDLELTDDPAQIATTGGNARTAYMGELATLLVWHEEDPVDAPELWRNEVVFEDQENRKPFVDHPEWARFLFLAPCGVFADGFESGDLAAWSSGGS